MEFDHVPIMLNECLDGLLIKPDGVYIDGTLGGAGHSKEIYKRLNKDGLLVGIDQDAEALSVASGRLRNLKGQAGLVFVNDNFRNIKEICLKNKLEPDGILLDIGVSSYQLDEASRGFSYQHDAPLDMRMDKSKKFDASEVVNSYSFEELRKIIREYGEEKWASRIAEFIVNARIKKPIKTTYELVDIIKAAIPSSARRDGPHPAKRTFQAIRIEVNDELGALKQAIKDCVEVLKPGGRLCIITFHSLEDRIVKTEFASLADSCTCPPGFPVCICGNISKVEIVTRKPITPSHEELDLNPRARSSKLRIVQKKIT